MNTSILRRLLLILLGAATSFVLFQRVLLLFTYNIDLGGIEHYFCYQVLKMDDGAWYTDPERFPFHLNQYPPLYFYMVKILALGIQGVVGDEVRAVFIAGRSLNLFANIGTVWLLYHFMVGKGVSRTYSLIAALVGFNLFIMHFYAMRPDSLKVFLLALAYYSVAVYLRRDNMAVVFGTVFSLTLALLTKQDAFLHVVIIGVLLFTSRKWKAALVLVLCTGALTLVSYGVLLQWDTNIFYLNLVKGISQGIDPVWFISTIGHHLLAFAATLLLFIFLVGETFYRQTISGPIVFGMVLLLLFDIYALFKWGSDINYFVELQIALVLSCIYLIQSRGDRLIKIVLTISLLLIGWNNYQNRYYKYISKDREALLEERYSYFRSSASLLKESMGKDQKVVSFIPEVNLFMEEQMILGTLVNEYPELYFTVLKEYVATLPKKLYNYALDCDLFAYHDVVFVTYAESETQHIDALKGIVGDPNLYLRDRREVSGLITYNVTCE